MSNANRSLKLLFSKNTFIGSFYDINNIPEFHLPEFCFIGRSNVGKSTIINSITKNKKLAKTSKTPGLTKSINLFKIDNTLNIIDLPGYGYAKVSKDIRNQLLELIESYILNRKNLINIFVLIDCKIGLKDSDIDIFDFISTSNNKFSIILTKIDKCSFGFTQKQIDSIKTLMNNYKKNFIKIFSSSSKKNEGILDIQKEIFNLSKKYEI